MAQQKREKRQEKKMQKRRKGKQAELSKMSTKPQAVCLSAFAWCLSKFRIYRQRGLVLNLPERSYLNGLLAEIIPYNGQPCKADLIVLRKAGEILIQL